MKRFLLAMAAASSLISVQAFAGAYQIDYTTLNGDTADLLVTTTDLPLGSPLTVTGIYGERDGDTITGLSSYAGSDQLIYKIDPYVDFSGISFSTTDGNAYNLFTNSGYFELSSAVDATGYPQNGVGLASVSIADVPEPFSLTIVGMGLISLSAVRRRNRTTV